MTITDTSSIFRVSIALILSGFLGSTALAKQGQISEFTWDNATVYFVMTDRFFNGDKDNDHSYGRMPDGEREVGTFHGGDLKGLTRKLHDNYFTDLGVNVIWITAPYQQILGWVVGGDKAFKHYAYHGYYALDYTILDANMGSEEDLREFIDTAHDKGIRVLFDIVMNHPGYGDAITLNKYQVSVLWEGWEEASVRNYYGFIDFNDPDWKNWWGGEWVRTDLPGYKGGGWDEETKQLAYLPDFRTESEQVVGLPPFYQYKGDTRAEAADGYTVRKYLIKWLTDWVREYGVDGFRADTVKHVEPEAWFELKREAVAALREWKSENPGKKIDDRDFWMTGEVWGQGVERNRYFDHGFDSLINFEFQEVAGRTEQMEDVFSRYAEAINTDPGFNVLSYISSHDTHLFDREKLIEAGSFLLLLPGGVQIFYGDETARPKGPAPPSDRQQETRSDMNWENINQSVLQHWQRLGQFRNRHPSVGAGSHRKLADKPYTFVRHYRHNGVEDQVIVAVGVSGNQKIPVGEVFADGVQLRDAYTGQSRSVKDGHIEFSAGDAGVVLIEAVPAPS